MILQIILLFQVFATVFANPRIQVKLPQNDVTITGETIIESSLNKQLHRFRGIPFAQPPVGSLRFRKPLPWIPPVDSTQIEALAYSDKCIQIQMQYKEDVEYLDDTAPKMSENCLYLNVWTPEVGEEKKLRPVLVWIHGGGLYFGSSSFDLYNGETLASRSDAVVVSMNYRLSTLGFFYSDTDPTIPGNQGLWDQALALQWVQDNIRQFGGDPNQVTIVGESAGSWSVSAHLVSPVSRDLYSNAILMSGAVLSVNEPDSFVCTVLPVLKKAGCAAPEETSISPEVIECLKKLDPFEVDKMLISSFGIISNSILIKDGVFFPDTPENLLSTGNHKKSFNLLLSTVADEAPFVPFFFPNDTRLKRFNPTDISLEESKQVLVSLFQNQESFPKDLALKVYYTGLNGQIDRTSALNREKISIAYGDYILGCPTMDFAKRIYASSPDDVGVYQWYYTAKIGNFRKWMCNEWSSTACHTDDLFPLFGLPFRYPVKFHNRERDISNEVIDFVKSFIRTGKPGPNQKEWEPYFQAGTKVIAPYYQIDSNPKTPESFKFNLKHLECETIWKQYSSIYNCSKLI